MQRYFINDNQIKDNLVFMTKNDAYHMEKVMRMKPGTEIIINRNNGETYLSKIIEIADNQAIVELISLIPNHHEMPIEVTIAHGLVRREKMEDTIEKLTQLGTYSYYPVIMKRSNVKFLEERFDKRLSRLEKIVKEASEQSRRSKLMQVFLPISFKDLLKLKSEYNLLLYAYEDEHYISAHFKKMLKTKLDKVLIVIGPEAGFDKEEVNALNQAGFLPISLGPRILRTEVAPLYIMSAISFALELGDENDEK